MANIFNIGTVAIYTKNPVSGEYEYDYLYNLLDYINEDGSINIEDNISFGASFDIINNHLFIGCPNESPLVDEEYDWRNDKLGAVYVFDLINNEFIQKIIPDNTPGTYTHLGNTGYVARRSNFGYSMYAGDDYIIIGAPGYCTNSGTLEYKNSGEAYVYKFDGAEYALTYTITANDKVANNRFGNYIHGYNSSIVIGSAPAISTSIAGYVNYYELSEDRDTALVKVTISNTHINTSCDIKLHKNNIAIGTPDSDSIKIYTVASDSSLLTYTIYDRLTKSFNVGRSIAFDGDNCLITGCPNGYKKTGIALRFTNIGQKYTLI